MLSNITVRLEVIDTGPGISAVIVLIPCSCVPFFLVLLMSQENLPKLFGQYVQFDANALQGGKGSGLGLWLSKTIVEMHGGVIGATSEGLGQGCVFFLE